MSLQALNNCIWWTRLSGDACSIKSIKCSEYVGADSHVRIHLLEFALTAKVRQFIFHVTISINGQPNKAAQITSRRIYFRVHFSFDSRATNIIKTRNTHASHVAAQVQTCGIVIHSMSHHYTCSSRSRSIYEFFDVISGWYGINATFKRVDDEFCHGNSRNRDHLKY